LTFLSLPAEQVGQRRGDFERRFVLADRRRWLAFFSRSSLGVTVERSTWLRQRIHFEAAGKSTISSGLL
jgi:hypothetical protein